MLFSTISNILLFIAFALGTYIAIITGFFAALGYARRHTDTSIAAKIRTFIIALAIGIAVFVGIALTFATVGIIKVNPTQTTNSKISSLQIWTQFPETMELKQSYVIEVSLISTTGKAFVSDITVEKATSVVNNATLVGTPNATLQNAFGPGYEAIATATLYAGTFTIEPNQPQERSIRQSKVVWDWNVTPQEPGKQVISEEIEITWKPTIGSKHDIAPYVIGNPQISVQVNPPGFDWTPVIVPVLSGAFLASLTWLGTQLWKLISRRRENKSGKKPIGTQSNKHAGSSKRKRSP